MDKDEEKIKNKTLSSIRKEQAIRLIINDLINGGLYNAITNKLVDDNYNLGYKYGVRSAQCLIAEARRRIKEDMDEAYPELKEQVFQALMDIVTEAREQGDRANAIKALQEVSKLGGLYSTEKVDVNHQGVININFGLDN